MKHPRYETLQDYFENALNSYQEGLVKAHLLDCDECTKVLADFSVIENKLRAQKVEGPSAQLTSRILQDAQDLLRKKQQQVQLIAEARNQNRERIQKGRELLEEWRNSILPDLRVPALQVCSLSLVVIAIIAMEKQQEEEIKRFSPISTQVQEYTYQDVDMSEEKK